MVLFRMSTRGLTLMTVGQPTDLTDCSDRWPRQQTRTHHRSESFTSWHFIYWSWSRDLV